MHMIMMLSVKNLTVLERIVKLLELVCNTFVFVYTIKYVQFTQVTQVT